MVGSWCPHETRSWRLRQVPVHRCPPVAEDLGAFEERIEGPPRELLCPALLPADPAEHCNNLVARSFRGLDRPQGRPPRFGSAPPPGRRSGRRPGSSPRSRPPRSARSGSSRALRPPRGRPPSGSSVVFLESKSKLRELAERQAVPRRSLRRRFGRVPASTLGLRRDGSRATTVGAAAMVCLRRRFARLAPYHVRGARRAKPQTDGVGR